MVTSREGRPWALAGAAAVLALGVWYLTFAQPAAARIDALETRHAAARQQLAGLANAGAVDQERARVAALQARVRDAIDRMSQDIQMVQILKQLASHAVRYQIVVDRLEVKGGESATPGSGVAAGSEGPSKKPAPQPAPGAPGAEKATKPALDIRTQRIELELSCSYEAAARFIDDLKTLPTLLIVDKLDIQREPGGPKLKVLLTLKVHSIKQPPPELKA